MSSLQFEKNDIVLPYFLTREQQSVVQLMYSLMSPLLSQVSLYLVAMYNVQIQELNIGVRQGLADIINILQKHNIQTKNRGTSTQQMPIPIILLLLLPTLTLNQEYPSCPGGAPLTLGNSTDPYNFHLIQLSTFLSFTNQQLQQAFEQFLSTGSESQVNVLINKNKTFFIAITVLLIFVSVVLFILLVRIGNMKFTDKDKFQKLKENGYSSPLSAFFTLLAVALLIFTSFSAYLVPSMINSVKMTECRMDGLNNAFLKGVPQYGWDGVSKYIQKINIIQNLAINLKNKVLQSNLSDLSNLTAYGNVYFRQALSLYNGIKDKYEGAQITYNQLNSSQNIALTSLIPTLFSSNQKTYILEQLQKYFSNVQSSMDAYDKLQHILNDTYPQLTTINNLMNSSATLLSQIANDYLSQFITFRKKVNPYFQSAQYTLILCQVVTGVCVVCCLVSIITIRLIQSDFDFFSLKIYKIIWACHILVFCLNLTFLLIFNEMIIYGEGACAMSQKVLKNQTLLKELIPSASNYSGMYILNSCSNTISDFSKLTKTSHEFTQFGNFVQLKESILTNYNKNNITSYPQIFENIKYNLTPYRVSTQGTYSFLNQQLARINNILSNNPYSQYCFKHHWEYYPTACNTGQPIIILPNSKFLPTLTQLNYKSTVKNCYILSSFDSYNPHFINYTEFLALYSRFMGKCTTSLNSLGDPLNMFFGAEIVKQNVISNLISQIFTLQPYLYNATYYLASYLNQRITLLNGVFSNLSSNTNYNYISNGNSCSIVGSLVSGIYNEFCVNFRAQGRQVYLIVFCNLAYSIFLILLSFLYSLELQSLNDDQRQMEFQKTSGVIISDEGSSLAELKSVSQEQGQKK